MPHIGQIVPYFNSQGQEKAAVICAMHPDGTYDLQVFSANTRRVEGRTWTEPGTCTVKPEASEDLPMMKVEVNREVVAPETLAHMERLMTGTVTTLTSVPAEGETTTTED